MFGVAISTHRRPEMLAQALTGWAKFMPDVLVVNHDVEGEGVAATKNRGITALMDAGCDHLLLCDDDVWPLSEHAWSLFARDPISHLMLCWGKRRLIGAGDGHTYWSHPRGVALYSHRSVIERVGGMRTELGKFGHEHVEWSQRIHAAGLTPQPFVGIAGHTDFWHCEDMGRPGETSEQLGVRRRALTTVRKSDRDFAKAEQVMAEVAGRTDFVDYRHAGI